MATKKAAVKKTAAQAKKAAPSGRASVRMYRQGLGDCFLVTLPREGKDPFRMVIDCGVILGTENAGDKITKVVQSIHDETKGHLDLLVATHEHWDHLSGFVQANDLFKTFAIDEVWLGWTESDDPLAKKLKSEHNAMRMALGIAQSRAAMAGDSDTAADVSSMLEFFGAAGGNSTGAALDNVKGYSKKVRYCYPTDAPVMLSGTTARAYVLGPPHDEAAIKRFNPSAAHPETYGMSARQVFLAAMTPALTGSAEGDPFDSVVQIPMAYAQQLPFFDTHYFDDGQDWRRIDGDWLGSASDLALQLDSATNNTSLVLAIELDNGEVLLFAADAQVGNWLSWQDLSWKVDGKDVKGSDLLARAVFYKVGHHGSHNATLKEKGLEEMTKLQVAMIPVDHDMAVKKRWGAMPLDALVKRLGEVAKAGVLRVDQPVPAGAKVDVDDPLYYQVSF